MNLSDLLQPNDNAPKRPPISHENVSDDSTTQSSSPPPGLDKQQQDFLAEIRKLLPHKITDHLAEGKRIEERFSRLLNHTQRGSWENFWPLISSLRELGTLSRRGTIVLGGWHRKPTSLKPPSSDLTLNLFSLGVYGEMLNLIKIFDADALKSPKGSRALIAIREWADQFSPAFSSSIDNGQWQVERLTQKAKTEIASLIPIITEHLLFMEDQAFIFYPSPDDPAAGWDDFFNFTWCYNFLPDDIKRSFKSHYLIFQTPSP